MREDERTGLAREVHDELGQALTGLKMDPSWLEKRGLRHSRHRHPIDYRLHHAHSTLRRESGILVCVHLGPPVGNTDDFALISFLQSDRGDNVLRIHS